MKEPTMSGWLRVACVWLAVAAIPAAVLAAAPATPAATPPAATTPAAPAAKSATPTAPAAPTASADDLRAILRLFFAEEDAAKRAELAGRVGAAAPKSWADLKAMLHAAAPRPALPAGRQTFTTVAGGGMPSVKYLLRVPTGYAADAGRGWPLIITCHGTGGNAEGALGALESWMGPDIENYLAVAAESPREGVYEPGQTNTLYPREVLDDVRRRANVDSDRVLLTGVSKGGYATWAAALFTPGEWAGAAPIACYPATEAGAAGAILYLPNVLAVPVQAHWGGMDIEPGQNEGINTLSRDAAAEMKRLAATKFEGIEYSGEGHGLKVKADRLRAFFAAARRDPFPAECRLLFHHLYQGRNFYARATALAREEFNFRVPREVKVAGGVTDPRAVKRALLTAEGFELTARLPAGKNLVGLMARNLKEIEVDLPAERLDFSRAVRVTVNSRTVAEAVRKIDWVELLETVRRTGDFDRLVAGRVKVTVPGVKTP